MCKFVSYRLVCSGVISTIAVFAHRNILMCFKDLESEINLVTKEKAVKMEKKKAVEIEKKKIIEIEKNNTDGEKCPLCLEKFEFDEKKFFPCTCNYQVCLFCWHRIRTNENGLCPNCREVYKENPAIYHHFTAEEIEKARLQKRKDLPKRQKIENRKQLANTRVIQKNLVFAVGLPLELSQDSEKKEMVLQMFRQFGQTLKEAITDRTTYAGSQGPSACVYITYQRAEDAVNAVRSLNNTKLEGRTIKVALGTTKYCSNFLKNIQCPKVECLYLHELADEEASFTKEDIHLGKHFEYEQKVLEETLQSISQSKFNSPSSDTNRTNHNPNLDNCSECSDEAIPNGSFYDSSEASELSPSSNSQNLENRSTESEHDYQNVQPVDIQRNPDSSSNQVFTTRSGELFIVNNHTSNSNFQDSSSNSVNTSYNNQMQQRVQSMPQSNFMNNQFFESALKNREQPTINESAFYRISNLVSDNESKSPYPDILNMKQSVQSEQRKRDDDDDADLEFDPCQEGLDGLKVAMLEERERLRIEYSSQSRTPTSNKFPSNPIYPINHQVYRNIHPQSYKIRDPPPGFTAVQPQNIIYRSSNDSGNCFLNKTPITALQNQFRTNYPFQRFPQPGLSMNNAVVEYSPHHRDVPDIVPQMYQQHNQRFMNIAPVQSPHIEQRSNPVWNNSIHSQWRPVDNSFINHNTFENRATNDLNLRVQQFRPAEPSVSRQLQQMYTNVNNLSPISDTPQLTPEQVKAQVSMELLRKVFERNSSGLGHHRLQYTKKL